MVSEYKVDSRKARDEQGNQLRDYSIIRATDVELLTSSKCCSKCSDSGYDLKVELTEFIDELDR